jgi:hypothetical protein
VTAEIGRFAAFGAQRTAKGTLADGIG